MIFCLCKSKKFRLDGVTRRNTEFGSHKSYCDPPCGDHKQLQLLCVPQNLLLIMQLFAVSNILEVCLNMSKHESVAMVLQ